MREHARRGVARAWEKEVSLLERGLTLNETAGNTKLARFIDNHDVIYIRHLMFSNREAYRGLISERIAAIHYSLKEGVDKSILKNYADPANYKGAGESAMKRLSRYSKAGAIVVADYSAPRYTSPKTDTQKAINIGILPEKTSVEVMRYEPEPDHREICPFGLFYHQVRLSNVVELGYSDYASILAIHPRGNTVIHWREGEKAIKFIYRRELGLGYDAKSVGFEVLFPAQQEVLCSEYLRLKAPQSVRLKHLLLPVGRGMKSIDIYGSNETKIVLAQVSFTADEDELKEKISALKDSVSQSQNKKELVKVYFGPKKIEGFVHKNASDVLFVSLEKVFEAMEDTGILDDMLGVELR